MWLAAKNVDPAMQSLVFSFFTSGLQRGKLLPGEPRYDLYGMLGSANAKRVIGCILFELASMKNQGHTRLTSATEGTSTGKTLVGRDSPQRCRRESFSFALA